MRIGKVILTFELLEKLLRLDGNHHIIDVWEEGEDRVNRRFSVLIAGDDMPKHLEGAPVRVVTLCPVEEA